MLFPQNAFLPLPYVTRIAYSLQLLCTMGLQRLDFSLLQVKDELSPKNAGNASFLLFDFCSFSLLALEAEDLHDCDRA